MIEVFEDREKTLEDIKSLFLNTYGGLKVK
jgi:hypothetical protein